MKSTYILLFIVIGLIALIVGILAMGNTNDEDTDDTTEQTGNAVNNNDDITDVSDNETIDPIEEETSDSSGNTGDEDLISASELATYTGVNGNRCYIAYEGVVYDMTNADNWSNGVHTTSNGLARCGNDLTSVMRQAPHGEEVLNDSKITVVGNYGE